MPEVRVKESVPSILVKVGVRVSRVKEGVRASRAKDVECVPVWRVKMSHFQPSVEVAMKSVDKSIDKPNKQ